jgi:hypothetical protein
MDTISYNGYVNGELELHEKLMEHDLDTILTVKDIRSLHN